MSPSTRPFQSRYWPRKKQRSRRHEGRKNGCPARAGNRTSSGRNTTVRKRKAPSTVRPVQSRGIVPALKDRLYLSGVGVANGGVGSRTRDLLPPKMTLSSADPVPVGHG